MNSAKVTVNDEWTEFVGLPVIIGKSNLCFLQEDGSIKDAGCIAYGFLIGVNKERGKFIVLSNKFYEINYFTIPDSIDKEKMNELLRSSIFCLFENFKHASKRFGSVMLDTTGTVAEMVIERRRPEQEKMGIIETVYKEGND